MIHSFTLDEFVETVHNHSDNLIQYYCYESDTILVAEYGHAEVPDTTVRIGLDKSEEVYYFTSSDENVVGYYDTENTDSFINGVKNLDDIIKGDSE